MHNRDSGASPGADPGSETRTLGQVTPDGSGPCGLPLGRRSRGGGGFSGAVSEGFTRRSGRGCGFSGVNWSLAGSGYAVTSRV